MKDVHFPSPTQMRAMLPLAEEREGNLSHRKHEVNVGTERPHLGYIRVQCSCGWASAERDPLETGQYAAARDDAVRHLRNVEQERRS